MYIYSLFMVKVRKLQMNTEFKHKNVFKLWAQRKGEHSNIKREYVSNSVVGMYRYFCF